MVGHDQHGEAPADMRGEQIEQLVHLAFEARRDIMDRSKNKAIAGAAHSLGFTGSRRR
jgi:hypothetical protein